ncbi:MAG: hypothetical protein KAW12_16370 [Candidatus Aminicenantes bacterium]|nr:hypothetical protein [Candidatus Aminicenantes bacterium]
MTALLQSKGSEMFFEFLLKSSLILVFALFLSFLFRKKSASFRHFLLCSALIVLLLLPLLIAFAPGWQTGLFPALWPQQGPNLQNRGFELDNSPLLPLEKGRVGSASAVTAPGEEGALSPYFLLVPWCCGLVFMFLKIGFGLYGTFRLTHRGVLMGGYPWKQLFLLFLKKTPLRKKIRLLESKDVFVPMTWGFLKPVVLLPAGSAGWPLEQCSSVLFHELSHIERGDFLARLLSRVSCSLFWFNPLCWLVFRRIKKEQEKACDEMVLNAGIKPSTYASCLLRLKESIKRAAPAAVGVRRHTGRIKRNTGQYVPVTALGMAGSSEFKERITAILKKQLNPKEIKMKTKITLLVLVLFAVALIGTAKPNMGDPMNEDAAYAYAQDDVKEKKATKEKKEKKKIKEKAKSEKKCREVLITVEEEEEKGKKVKKVRKIIISPKGKADFAKIEMDGDNLIFYDEKGKVVKKMKLDECGEDIVLSGKGHKVVAYVSGDDDKSGKEKKYKILIKEGGKLTEISEEAFVKGEKGHIWVSKEKGKDGTIHIIKKKLEGKEGECEIAIALGEGGLTEDVHVIKSGEGKGLTWVVEKKGGAKDCETKVYKIRTKIRTDAGLEKSVADMKKALEKLNKELKGKSGDHVKTIKEMEKALKKMEKELENKDEELKTIAVTLSGDDDDLLHIKEAHKDRAILKKIKLDKGDIVSKISQEGLDFALTFILDQKIDKKQKSQLKKAVAKLQKKLPKSYKVKADIGVSDQEIEIGRGGKNVDKKTDEAAFKEIDVFEKELKKIFPGEESLKKKIKIMMKEEK